MAHAMSDEAIREVYDLVNRYGNCKGAAAATRSNRRTLNDVYMMAIKRLGLPDIRRLTSSQLHFQPELPPGRTTSERTLPELLKHRRDESERSVEAFKNTRLFNIRIKTDGPIGIMLFGDPHLDNPGTHFKLLEEHLEIAKAGEKYIFPGNIGDIKDNWVGRLAHLYKDTTISSKEGWKLTEWLFHGYGLKWLFCCLGNHDLWVEGDAPLLTWIAKHAGVEYTVDAGIRIAFKHPNGSETRLNAKHDFSGNSQYNPLHALKRETLFGHRDHIIVAGHRHTGADAGDVHGDGVAFQMVRVSGYKVVDHFAEVKGFPRKPIHPSALIIVDPDKPETDRARVFCAPSVEEGADYLKWKRERYETRARKSGKA